MNRAWDSAITAIIAAVNTQPAVTQAGANILVQEGEPGPDQPEDIIIVGHGGIQQTTTKMTMVGSGGAHWLWETYRIGVQIEVFRGGDDPLTTRNRCKALADAVDTAVRTDPSLGGVVLTAFPSRHDFSSAEWEANGHGRIVSCHMEIECEAQL